VQRTACSSPIESLNAPVLVSLAPDSPRSALAKTSDVVPVIVLESLAPLSLSLVSCSSLTCNSSVISSSVGNWQRTIMYVVWPLLSGGSSATATTV